MRPGWIIAVGFLAGCGFQISVPGGTAAGSDANIVDSDPGTADASDGNGPTDAVLPIDAPIDAMVVSCPANYVSVGNQTSKYLLRTNDVDFTTHYAACMSDGTHLAVVDTAPEAAQLKQLIDSTNNLPTSAFGPFVFVGSVQKQNQSTPSVGWLSATGPFNASFWDNGGDPNDAPGGEDGDEQVAAIWRNHNLLVDLSTDQTFAGLCECDGLASTTEYTTAVDDL